MKKYCVSLIFSFILLFFSADLADAATLFSDNFESGAGNWTKLYVGGPAGSENLWTTNQINGSTQYGAHIDSQSTIIDSVAGNITIPNYIFELDMTPVLGEDRNIDFRWVSNIAKYEVHFNNDGAHFAGKVVQYHLNNNTTYHVRVILTDKRIQFFINNDLLFDEIDNNYQFSGNEKIGLRVGTGATAPTEVWFDNIKVTTPTLDVPYFSQNALPWGPLEYDHAKSLGFGDSTINRWGCAVTSAAMVLSYNNIKKMEDGTDITPGSLNNWLKNNNGFATGTGTDGVYSYLIWPQVSRLTKILFNQGKAPVTLEHQRYTKQIIQPIKDSLNEGIPAILYTHNASTSGHFVVAKGEGPSSNTFVLNDPEWNVPDSSSFQLYDQMDRYIPSHTNLSYIVIVTNPSIQIAVTNPSSKKTGKIIQNNQTSTFDNIPSALYQFENPLANPSGNNIIQTFGTGVNVFMLPKPENGTYTIQFTSANNRSYTANIISFDTNGQNIVTKVGSVVGANNPETFILPYSQTSISKATKIITFQTMTADINELQGLNQIFYSPASFSLITLINQISLTKSLNQKLAAQKQAEALIQLLNNYKGLMMNDYAYQVLIEDITAIRASL